MENTLIVELAYQKSTSAQEDETAALRLVAKMFTEKILDITKSELGISNENDFTDGKSENHNNNWSL